MVPQWWSSRKRFLGETTRLCGSTGKTGECTEAGGCNFFIVWVRKDGRKELITAPLDDKTILDGVTRRSCLELVKERLASEIEVTERKFTVTEIMEAASEGPFWSLLLQAQL